MTFLAMPNKILNALVVYSTVLLISINAKAQVPPTPLTPNGISGVAGIEAGIPPNGPFPVLPPAPPPPPMKNH